MTFVAEKALREDQINSAVIALFVPSRFAKGYFFDKFLKSHANAIDLEKNGKIGPTDGDRPYGRYRLIRHMNWLNIISLVFVAFYIFPTLLQLLLGIYSSFTTGTFDFGTTALYLLMLFGFILALASPFVLFYARKESTVRLYVIAACIVPGLIGLVFGIFAHNIAFIALSSFAIVYPLWQSNRVGLLSVIKRK